jgi:D-glycero-alpha-D-manno-heptose-7-phosphate kinase
MPKSLESLLKNLEDPITASAPCRIDSGGTWDIKALALPYEGLEPVTLNIALNLRTYVTLLPFKSGWVKVSFDNYHTQEAFRFFEIPFTSPYGLYFAVASFFQLHGVEIVIHSYSPVNSGLGGSSTAVVATIKAFSIAKKLVHERGLDLEEMLWLAYQLEDAINGGRCGLQDQGAAVYGGVNKWTWKYSCEEMVFQRESIANETAQREISKRVLVAYSGKRHLSARINREWIDHFLEGKTRSGWIEANRVVHRFCSHMKEGRWKQAISELKNEVAIRRKITPEAFTPIIDRLMQESERVGCGARFAGAGGGGSVWAIGEIDDIQRLQEIWGEILKSTKKGGILECSVDPSGVREEG